MVKADEVCTRSEAAPTFGAVEAGSQILRRRPLLDGPAWITAVIDTFHCARCGVTHDVTAAGLTTYLIRWNEFRVQHGCCHDKSAA